MKQGKNKRNNTQNLKEYIQQLAQTGIKELTDIVFPPACPVCGGVLGFEKGRRRQICPDCDNRLEYIGEPRCMKCGKPLKKTDTQQFCYDCTVKRHFYERGVAVFAYTDGIKQSIYQFKYHDKREYAAFYGRQAAQQCGALIGKWDIDLVLPVPMYAAKQRKRGYNQAELIARELSKNLNLICASEILVRTRKTTPMKELNDEEMIDYYSNLVSQYGGKLSAKWVYGMVVYNGKETKKYTWSKGNFYLVNEDSKKRNPGYPLDSISIMPGCDKYFVDLTENDKKNNKENYNEDDVVKFIVDSIKI